MRNERFEKLASQEVGLSGSPYFFVSHNHEIVAVFSKKRNVVELDNVIDFAQSLGNGAPVLVEDSTGTAWENRASQDEQDRLAAEEDD